MPAPSISLEPLLQLAARAVPGARVSTEAMPGGASLRRFFRLHFDTGRTAVGMFFPEAAQSEEVSQQPKQESRWPFIEVLELLRGNQIRVPELLAKDTEHGWLLVEDLGDRTLAQALLETPDRKQALYQLAVRDMARAHAQLQTLASDCIVAQRCFDVELLEWEMNHFLEYALLARGISLSPAQHAHFGACTRQLAEQIRGFDYGFTHRDYQSRNLMVLGTGADALAWVDFQDAMLGPRVYDLVALLNDSYQTFDDAFVAARLDEYAGHRGLEAERERLHEEFQLVTVQRKLKDAGRFVYIDRVKHDSSYLKFVEPSIAKIRHAMTKLPGVRHVQELRTLLDEVLP